MCSQMLSGSWTKRGWLAGAVAAAVLTPGCVPDYVSDNSAPVNLYVAAVTPTVLASDVRHGTNSPEGMFTCPDFATLDVAVRYKNPLHPTPTVASAVFLESYTVRFFRTDGRGLEGVDVPYRITGNLTVAIDVADSGTDEIPIEVVRHQAKNEPPLSTIFQTTVLTTMAEITVYGTTTAGEKVSASGRMQIDFAEYGDDAESCEATN